MTPSSSIRHAAAVGMALLIAIASRGATARDGEVENEFDLRFQELRATNPANLGRDALADAWQQLLKDFPTNPGRPEAMLQIGHLYCLTNPKAGFDQSRADAARWYRQASKTARKHSATWYDAQLGLVMQLQRGLDRGPSHDELVESRQILESMLLGDVPALFRLRAEGQMMFQFRQENNPLGLQAQAEKVLQFGSGGDSPALTGREEQLLGFLQHAAASELIAAVTNNGGQRGAPLVSEERSDATEETLEQFARMYPQVRDVRNEQAARQGSSSAVKAQAAGRSPAGNSPIPPPPTISTRSVLIAVNTIVVIALGFMLIRRRA